MDLLTILGSDIPSQVMEANTIVANNGDDFFIEFEKCNYEFNKGLLMINELLATDFETEYCSQILTLSNWSSGYENFIGDLWFKFVQFIKKLVRTIKTWLEHFIKGITLKLRWLEKKNIELRGIAVLNDVALGDTVIKAYSAKDYDELFEAFAVIRRVLVSIFAKQDLDLDGIMDFRKWGITFKNSVVYNSKYASSNDVSKQHLFDLNLQAVGLKKLKELGWEANKIPPLLEKLIDHVKFNLKKDFEYIEFQNAMDRLIREKTKSTKPEHQEITRLTNSAKTIATIIKYNQVTTWEMVKQMVIMVNALLTPAASARDDSIR